MLPGEREKFIKPQRERCLRCELNTFLSFSTQSRSFFLNALNTDSCLHSLLPPPRPTAVTSKLRSSQTFPKVYTRTQRYCCFIQYGLNDHYQHKANKSQLYYHCVLILVLLLVSFTTVMFHVGLSYFTYSFVFYCVLSLYLHIDVLISSAAQLQECLINLLTYNVNSTHCRSCHW